MAKTNRDVIEQALRLLNVAPLAGSAPGEEYAEGERQFDSLLLELDDIHQLGLGFVANNLPDWAFMPLAKATAGRAAVTFGLVEYISLETAGMRDLRAYAANETRTNQHPHVEYF